MPPQDVWRTAGGWARAGIVIVVVVSAGCGVYVSFGLVRPPSPLSDESSAPIWMVVFPLLVAVLLGIAGGVVASVRSHWGRAPVAGVIATVPASFTTIVTLLFTAPKGDGDGLWALIYPAATVWAIVLFVLASVASLLGSRFAGTWLPVVFVACIGFTALAVTPGRAEASRTASTSWVTLGGDGGHHLTRAEAAKLLDAAQRHAVSVDNSQLMCGFEMTYTQVASLACGPTSAPPYPYGPDWWGPPFVLSYGVERVEGTWRVVPPPVEAEVPPGAPPAVPGPYATPTYGPVHDLDGHPVDLGR